MNKIAYWIMGFLFLAVIIVAFVGFTIFIKSRNPSSPTGVGVNTGSTLPSVPVSGGGTVAAKDFKSDPATVKDPINSGYYYLGYHSDEGFSDPTASANPPYIIEYIDSTQYFSIVLLQEPIKQIRQEMEQYLMAHLGISQSQMCQLKYMVSVPARVDSTYAGTSLGFSFCPGAVQLP